MLDRPPNSPRASAKPSCNSPRRVRKRSNNCDCYSEKQVDRASGKAFALPGYRGLRRSGRTAVQDSLRLKNRLHSRNRSIFFGPEARTISTNQSPLAQFFEHASIYSPSIRSRMGAQTYTLQWGQISCSLLYLLRSIGSLEQFGTRSRSSYERVCWIGDFRFVFVFRFCFPMFVYQVKTVPHIPLYMTSTYNSKTAVQYRMTPIYNSTFTTVQYRTFTISAPMSHTCLTALLSTFAARDLYCTPGTSINCPDISTLYRRYIFFCGIYSIRTSRVTCCDYIYILCGDTYIMNTMERQFFWRSPSTARTRTIH